MAYQLAARHILRSPHALRVKTAQVEQPFPVQMAALGSASRYAILKLGGVRQMVEEGHDYTCPKRYLQEAQTGDSSERVVFQNNVLGLRSGGEFKWGKPFVADAAVEVEVLEEFPGPVVTVAAGIPEADTDVMMARYRVKTIRNSSSAH